MILHRPILAGRSSSLRGSSLRGSALCGNARRGTVVALLALSIVALVGFLGLAIDLGMIALARTQAQNAADLASLTAARTMNGNAAVSYNKPAATINAQNLLTYNRILGQKIVAKQLTLTYGSYDYNQSTQAFAPNFPETAGVPTTAVQATVKAESLQGGFSRVFGSQFLPTVTATATAVHRPRDIGLVVDLSSSMRFGTALGYDITSTSRATNNPDTLVPTFGHYSSSSAVLTGTSSNRSSSFDGYTISPSNTTTGGTSYALTYINGFYAHAAYASTLIRAFDSYTSTDGGILWSAPGAGASPQLPPASYAATPGGDRPLFRRDSTADYAKDVNDVLVSSGTASPTSADARRWELDGYSATTNGSFTATDPLAGKTDYASSPFKGYTQGPGYYGKTFFIWPPDPRRPLNTGTATAWSSTAADASAIKQFLTDFGYGPSDFGSSSVQTTLAASVTTSSSTITVNSTTAGKFPAPPFRVIVNNSEIMKVSGVNSTKWTVSSGRAQDGTTAVAASSGATVRLMTGPPLLGIYTAANSNASPGKTPATSQTWPWPAGDDASGASSLSKFLLENVYIPSPQIDAEGKARLLTTGDDAFQKLMRLYNWNYVIDNTGATPCDWRIRFFGTDSNSVLFNSSGTLNPPGSTGMCSALQTYNEILRWLTQSPNPFPTQLRAGRIKYYGSIPTEITGSWPSYGGTDQRFWVEAIDHMLGFYQTAAGTYANISAMTGYGPDFTWGSVVRNGPPSATQYLGYTDNPKRPLLRHWLSPILMVDYLHNYNMYQEYRSTYFMKQPGDSYEAPLYPGRIAFLAAINTLEHNHPNDWFTLALYSKPRHNASSTNRFNSVACPLGTNYNYARSSLLFPVSTINADGTCNNTEVTPFDPDPATGTIPSANFSDTPRPRGGTCFAMGLMLCYNQFAVTTTSDTTLRSFTTSSPITFPTGIAGGLGRKGAQKLIIFETDGLANSTATANLVNATGYNYYKIRYDMNKPSNSEYPTTDESFVNDPVVLSQIYSLVGQLKTDYGTGRNPFRLYAIGFGPVFSGADADEAKSTLQKMQFYAGTQSDANTALPSNQIITGTDAQMSANMIATYTNILQKGVQIALIK
ncbi:MAG: pilus assembly protein TadG-related protein [Gemmataceae bacterium]|nr:pilus assembly protein TadG-related protein [Gemmataceae bacterium]